MIANSSFLDTLANEAERAAAAEEDFRREAAERAKALERERAFAHRRLNFMRAVAETVASADSEEVAVAAALGIMRAKLGWASDSEARAAVLSQFAPVAQAVFAGLSPVEEEGPPPDVVGALAAFEAWYADTHTDAFWVLFDHYMPETPLVDF